MTSRRGRSVHDEGRWLRVGQVGFLLIVAAVCFGQRAEAACLRLAGDGIGGTGLEEGDEGIGGLGFLRGGDGGIDPGSGDEDDGIGGMGLTDLSAAELDRYRGSGFTPDEAKTPSMGIYGTVTGLGDICLNGLRVVLPDDAVIAREGETIGPESLRLGHVVSVAAVNRHGAFTVASAALRPAIEGPVTATEPGERGLEVMGQRIELIPDAVIEDDDRGEVSLGSFAVGDFAVVHGLRGSGGTVLASHVSRRALATDRARVRGLLAAGSRSLWVGGVPIDPPARAEPTPGQWVVATGRWNPERASLEDVELEPSLPIEPGVERVSVEALVGDGGTGRTLIAAGLEIETSDVAAQIIEELPDGTRLWLRGRILSDGHVDILNLRVAPTRLFTPFGSSEAEELWWLEQRDLLPEASRLDVDRRPTPSVPLQAGQWAGRPVQAIRQGLIPR